MGQTYDDIARKWQDSNFFEGERRVWRRERVITAPSKENG